METLSSTSSFVKLTWVTRHSEERSDEESRLCKTGDFSFPTVRFFAPLRMTPHYLYLDEVLVATLSIHSGTIITQKHPDFKDFYHFSLRINQISFNVGRLS